jgi:hypothetical protein
VGVVSLALLTRGKKCVADTDGFSMLKCLTLSRRTESY